MRRHFSQANVKLWLMVVSLVTNGSIYAQHSGDTNQKMTPVRVGGQLARVKLHLSNAGYDTSSFAYIPVVITQFESVASHPIDSTNLNVTSVLSEVLLFARLTRRIVGSCNFCSDSTITMTFTSRKFGYPSMPCRLHERLTYLNISNYTDVNRIYRSSVHKDFVLHFFDLTHMRLNNWGVMLYPKSLHWLEDR